MSEIKPRLTNGEALALARENRKRVDDAMQAEVERDAQGCKDEITELRAALAAAQAEVKRLDTLNENNANERAKGDVRRGKLAAALDEVRESLRSEMRHTANLTGQRNAAQAERDHWRSIVERVRDVSKESGQGEDDYEIYAERERVKALFRAILDTSPEGG